MIKRIVKFKLALDGSQTLIQWRVIENDLFSLYGEVCQMSLCLSSPCQLTHVTIFSVAAREAACLPPV